jgi:hypothetical protein
MLTALDRAPPDGTRPARSTLLRRGAAAASGPTCNGMRTAAGCVRVDVDHTGAAAGRRGDGRRAQCDGGACRDVLRIGERPGELALPAGLERDHLVLRTRQLGSALSVRLTNGEAEAPDHVRRVERDSAAPRGRKEPDVVLRRGRPRERSRPVLQASVSRRVRREARRVTDARRRRPRRDAVSVGPLLCRCLLHAGYSSGRPLTKCGWR